MPAPDTIDTSLTFAEARATIPDMDAQLADAYYNARITYFDRLTREVWLLGVERDDGPISFIPGQYGSVGLGLWEPRVDDAIEADIDKRWHKLVRRSLSISSPIFTGDFHGAQQPGKTADLVLCDNQDEVELYVVLVAPEDDFIPGLTPRLALKGPGDRLFMGRKMAGRYTTTSITDPNTNMVFLSTGTGEAPHNPMITDLLCKGHTGQIISAVTARHWSDLVYVEQHRALEERFPNYKYVALPTREPDVPKRYIQDLVQEDFTSDRLGVELNPENTHVFLCGNPAMIGLPETVDGQVFYPDPPGVVGLLIDSGFTVHKRKEPGNIHVEEYW